MSFKTLRQELPLKGGMVSFNLNVVCFVVLNIIPKMMLNGGFFAPCFQFLER